MKCPIKKKDVKEGNSYVAKVSGKLARIRIGPVDPKGGWFAMNLETGRQTRIKSVMKLRLDLCRPAHPDSYRPCDAYRGREKTRG